MKKRIQTFYTSLNLKNVPAVLRIYILIAFLSPVLANEKPLIIKYNGELFFPAFTTAAYFPVKDVDGLTTMERTESIDWKNITSEFILFAPVSWSAGHSDLENGNYVSPFAKQYFIDNNGDRKELPFSKRHFLGTTRSGEDVLAGLIHGTRISVWIGFASMFIAGMFGVLIGGLAGFLGDYKFKVSRIAVFYFILMLIPAWYYSFTIQSDGITACFSDSIIIGMFRLTFSVLLFAFVLLWPLLIKVKLKTRNYFTGKISIPIDFIIMRIIEIFLSLPRMVLILTIAAITKPSVSTLVLIIGLTSWTDIARITRAELLKLREVDFINAEKSIGLGIKAILFKHILPNITPVIITVLIFGVASAIMMETGLSFLGIGLPAGTVTWGTLMFAAKENFMAWWLVLFPGLAISILLISLNNYGKRLS
ncbi:MAG: ABC transporter permease [Bacteroidia bacterium]|nr:ABC transporter permease [Bacteroidia bacterium]